MKTAEQFKQEAIKKMEARQEQYRDWADRAEKGEIPDDEARSSVYRTIEETIGNCIGFILQDIPTA